MSEDSTATEPSPDDERPHGRSASTEGRPADRADADPGGRSAGSLEPDEGGSAEGRHPGRGSDGAGEDADATGGSRGADDEESGSLLADLVSGVRMGQFASVGVVGATTETLLVAALTAGFGVVAQVAKLVGAEASITLMFLINDRWTFAGEGGEDGNSLLRRYLKSHGVRLGGLAVGFAVLTILVDFTEVTLPVAGVDFWPTVANAIGIGCGMVLNYVAESLITWKVHR